MVALDRVLLSASQAISPGQRGGKGKPKSISSYKGKGKSCVGGLAISNKKA